MQQQNNRPALEMERLPCCPLCGQGRHAVWAEVRDHQKAAPGAFTIVRCEGCGLLFQNPRPAGESLHVLYRDDYGPYTEEARNLSRIFNPGKTAADRWKNRVKRDVFIQALGYPADQPLPFLRRLAARLLGPYLLSIYYRLPRWRGGGEVLEIGSSRGYFLEVLREFGWKPTGLEWDARLAREVSERLGMPVLETLESLRTVPDAKFDAVVLWHVLEHLPDPIGTLREAYRVLKPGGELRMVMPNTASLSARALHQYWTGIAEPRHYFHFTPKTLDRMMRRAGWASFRVRTIPSRGVWVSGLKYREESRAGSAAPGAWYERPAAVLFFSALSRIAAVFGYGDYLLAEGFKPS